MKRPRAYITAAYVSPPASELATEGRAAVNAEKRKIENYKKKITEFINLGGHPSNIWYIEKIDDYIAKLKYLILVSLKVLNAKTLMLDGLF